MIYYTVFFSISLSRDKSLSSSQHDGDENQLEKPNVKEDAKIHKGNSTLSSSGKYMLFSQVVLKMCIRFMIYYINLFSISPLGSREFFFFCNKNTTIMKFASTYDDNEICD